MVKLKNNNNNNNVGENSICYEFQICCVLKLPSRSNLSDFSFIEDLKNIYEITENELIFIIYNKKATETNETQEMAHNAKPNVHLVRKIECNW